MRRRRLRLLISLAGHDREFGAVGTPDSDELSDPAAHCANADFLACDYPRSRDQAAAGLMDCVNHLSSWFGKGASSGTLSGPHRSEGGYHAQRRRAGFPVGAEGPVRNRRGELMICVLSHDDPANVCRGRGWGRVIGILLVVSFALVAVVALMLLRRRRYRSS